MGGYYAFIGNKEDENIYYFDHSFPDDDPMKYTIDEIIKNDSDQINKTFLELKNYK